MKGLLKAKPASSQLITLLGITVASYFFLGLTGTWIITKVTGLNIEDLANIGQTGPINEKMVTAIRGMQAVQFVSLFLVPSLICSYLFSSKPANYLGLKAPGNGGYIPMGVLIMLVAIPFTAWLGLINNNIEFPSSWETWINDKEAEVQKTVEAILAQRTIGNLILNMIFIAGLAAVGEELLFRGMLQRIFTRMFRNHWAGIIVAAILFSAMHMQFNGFLPRFVLGVLLGAVYWYSGSLWVAITSHFVYNGVLLLLVYFAPKVASEQNMGMANSSIALGAAISFLLTAAVLRWVIGHSKTRYEEVYAEELSAKDHPF